MRCLFLFAAAAALVMANCGETNLTGSDTGEDAEPDAPADIPTEDPVTEDPASDPVDDPVQDPVVDTQEDTTDMVDDFETPASCPERILPVSCDGLPPDCPDGYFPESDGDCWSGECLHCIDGCQSDDDCVAIQVCGCYYHEGCGWAETKYRFALETDECIQLITSTCPGECGGEDCPPPCGGDTDYRCCGWCDPPDDTECVDGTCIEIITHMCM